MNYKELMEKSRDVMGTKLCKSCPVCDGKACRNTVPGPGAKGIGDVAMRNYDAWKNIRVNMDTITDNEPVSTELELFGKTFKYPIFAGPVGEDFFHFMFRQAVCGQLFGHKADGYNQSLRIVLYKVFQASAVQAIAFPKQPLDTVTANRVFLIAFG